MAQKTSAVNQESTFSRWYALTVAILGMTATFAVWAALAPLATQFQKNLNLSNAQTSTLIAIPVLLGALMRIPMGMLTDRYGGKKVFLALLAFSLIPTFALGTFVSSYSGLIAWALILGMAGTSFAVGVPYVSKWFPPEKQGLALGLFGMGNGGTAIAAYYAPRIAQNSDWHNVFLWFSIPLILVFILFLFAKDAPSSKGPGKSWAQIWQVIKENPVIWILSLFYFVTFGGFVTFANYIPKLIVDVYGMPKTTGGSVAAMFVIMATVARPLGGWLADKIGGKTVLYLVFSFMGVVGITLAIGLPLNYFTPLIWALGFIAGLGNGAVFKLVAQYFAKDTGVATGIVGASGGLGGFFPPLFLGLFRDTLGSYSISFILLTAFAAICILISLFLLHRLTSNGKGNGNGNGSPSPAPAK